MIKYLFSLTFLFNSPFDSGQNYSVVLADLDAINKFSGPLWNIFGFVCLSQLLKKHY